MRGLAGLIRLHRWRLDEKRRGLAELESFADSLEKQAMELEESLKDEQEVASSSVESGCTYGEFARDVIARREKLALSISQVDDQIGEANEELREIFQEVKRYEILHANRLRAAQEREEKISQRILDELGFEIFRRRQRSG